MRKFLGRKLRSEPTPVPGQPDRIAVDAEGITADMPQEQFEQFSDGRVSMVVPDLPFTRKPKR